MRRMPHWVVKCKNCGSEWKLEVSFPLDREFKRLYHFCPVCRKNSFHEIVKYVP